MVDMNSKLAASAYLKTPQTQTVPGSLNEENSKNETGFMDLVRDAAVNSLDTLKAGESASARAVTGEAKLTEVVEAVTAAELTLQTVVSIRDRMISAYQEIMRMPI